MNTLGNILWFFLGGFLIALYYALFGLLMCLTIIGIPFGVQLFKMAGVALCPFGRDVQLMTDSGCLPLVFNILWIVSVRLDDIPAECLPLGLEVTRASTPSRSSLVSPGLSTCATTVEWVWCG